MTISPPAAFTRSMVSFTLSRLRSTAKIFAPSSAKRTAVARPLPQPGPTQPAPVTIAIRSCRRPLMMLLQSDGVPAQNGRNAADYLPAGPVAQSQLARSRPGDQPEYHRRE